MQLESGIDTSSKTLWNVLSLAIIDATEHLLWSVHYNSTKPTMAASATQWVAAPKTTAEPTFRMARPAAFRSGWYLEPVLLGFRPKHGNFRSFPSQCHPVP